MTKNNSPLVSYIKISPNCTAPRNHSIDTITIHCVEGQCTVEALGEVFSKPSRRASSNYGIGYDGRIGLYVDEHNRSWCSSSKSNDNRAITIEVASDKKPPYAVKDAAYASLVDLCADICRRNYFSKVIWIEDKDKALAYEPKEGEVILTLHRWFADTSCPGEYLMSKMRMIADTVNALIDDKEVIYVVQCGAYSNKKNAEKKVKKLADAGFDAVILEVPK